MLELSRLASDLRAGNRRALSQAITLVESSRNDHREAASELLDDLQKLERRQGLRIGLSGTPGAGKSTFIDCIGVSLAAKGMSIAVLTVDPSSARTGGSILGDKTRMERLSRVPNAFIRPSPTRNVLGGVSRYSKDCVFLCEQAGFDIIIVETTGIGQSETAVSEITDVFALLITPSGGDDLQGVKRGVMELTDLVLVNKADGDLRGSAIRTQADYSSALHLIKRRKQDPPGFPKAILMSARQESGMEAAWNEITSLVQWRKENGYWESSRREQEDRWFHTEVRRELLSLMERQPKVRTLVQALEESVAVGKISHRRALRELSKGITKNGIFGQPE